MPWKSENKSSWKNKVYRWITNSIQMTPEPAIGNFNCFLSYNLSNNGRVIYASINTVTEPEVKDNEGNIIIRKKSTTRSTPIGVIRLVPFPHPPHPEPGSSYAADALETSPSPSSPSFIIDRATTFHDGKESYIKLGRLAVLKEFRGSGIAKMVVSAAMTWAQQNPTYFNPSITERGMDRVAAETSGELPVWKGLVCVHAQEQVAKAWAKWGFQVDEGMGTWIEEGINHVGMFTRLNLENPGA